MLTKDLNPFSESFVCPFLVWSSAENWGIHINNEIKEAKNWPSSQNSKFQTELNHFFWIWFCFLRWGLAM